MGIHDAKHLSTWRECDFCHQEFLARSAKICRDCRNHMYEKRNYEKYEKWVEEGNKPEEI